MVRARLHIICGNCGCNDMFEYGVDMTGHDFGDRFEYSVSIKCDNCGTIHDLDENGEKLEIKNSNEKANRCGHDWEPTDEHGVAMICKKCGDILASG